MLDDIFAVQDDISNSVVKELRATLLGEEPDSNAGAKAELDVAQAAKGRATNPEAHRLYLQARYLIDRHNRDDLTRAIDYLNEAIALDEGFALAWSEVGFAHARQGGNGWGPVVEEFDRAREAVARALALEPDLPEGHAHMAWIQMYRDRDWSGAEASYARASSLMPGSAEVLSGASGLEYNLNRLDDAIALCRRALEQDPLSSATYHRLGLSLYRLDRFSEALDAFRKALELAPRRQGTHANMALALVGLAQDSQALSEAKAEPAGWARLWALAIVEHARGDREASDKALRELIVVHGGHAAVQIAEACGARGEVDSAFEWLERAYELGDPGLSEVTNSPQLFSLHGDPRWGEFLKKMGLED